MFIGGSLGFLLLATVEWLLMRLQLAIPENTLLRPEFFNRLLSLYGETAIFLFAIPLVVGLFYYLVPLQIGARSDRPAAARPARLLALGGGRHDPLREPRLHPARGGREPAAAALRASPSRPATAPTSGSARAGLVCLGFVFFAINMIATLRNLRAPGPRLAPPAALRLGGGGRQLAAAGDLGGDAGRDHDADVRPQRQRDLLRGRRGRRAAALAAPELDLLQRRLHADRDRRLRRDRRDRPRLLAQAAVRPPRGDGLAGGDRGARHAGLDAEHVLAADRDRLVTTSRWRWRCWP